MGYFANFMVYTLAMIGVIATALLVYKGTSFYGSKNGKSKYIKVLDTLSIAPRKTLYVVSAGGEKFLIAGDVDKTTLISKLETSAPSEYKPEETDIFNPVDFGFPKTRQGAGKSEGVSVIRSLAEKLK